MVLVGWFANLVTDGIRQRLEQAEARGADRTVQQEFRIQAT